MSAELLYYLLTGAGAGFSAGLLGIGGGLIIVPVLYLVFSTQDVGHAHLMHMALATSLATIVFTSISSTLAHQRRQAVLWPVVVLLAPGIMVGAWLGGVFAAELDTAVLKPVFGVFEVLVAVHLLRRAAPVLHRYSIRRSRAMLGGAGIGFISAIVGIGGGTMTVPFLNWHDIGMRNAVATSAACGLPIALAGSASYIYTGWGVAGLPAWSLGYVNLPAFAVIVVTSFTFAPLGARLAHAIPEQRLKTTFGAVLLLLGAGMLL